MKRVIIGIFAFIGFLFVGLIVAGIMLASGGSKNVRHELPNKIVLSLALDQGLQEFTPTNSLLDALQPQGADLHTIIQTLETARQDQRVVGLVVLLDQGLNGLASMQEFRQAVQRFRRSGKFAYVYADNLGESPAMAEYWLASAFDQVWLHPIGELAITGFAAEIPFAKDALDKLGVKAEILHAGKYKSYPETVMRSDISPENRYMTLSLLENLQSQFLQDVAESRHLAQDDVATLMKDAPLSADRALIEGLIDSIGYRDEFDSYIEQTTKGAQAVAFNFYQAYGPRPAPGERMALINVAGTLTSAKEEEAVPGKIVSAEAVSSAIGDAAASKSVKAIIVRVDSPGGTPLAADMIRRSIELARTEKPVIVSMSNTAASGGYWMSSSASSIIAQPSTLTGSIGVFGGKVNASGLWKKLGINWQALPENANGDLWSINRGYSEQSQAKIENLMKRTYDMFIARVSKGRNMPADKVENLAQGRVWTGAQAVQTGLVDQLGGLDIAINKAKELAKIPVTKSVTLQPYPKPLSPMEKLMRLAQQGLPINLLSTWMRESFAAMIQNLLVESGTVKISY